MATYLSLLAIDLSTRKRISPYRFSRLCTILIWLLVATPAFSQIIVESRPTYELITDAAIETLPDSLRSWFADRDKLIAAVFTTRQDRIDIRIEAQSGHQHFTWLKMPVPDKRNARKKTDFRSLLTVARIEGRSLTLVEMIQKQHAALIEAFRGRDAMLITTTAGQLMHYVIDASLPSHVAVVEHDWRGPSATNLENRIERLAFHESKVLDTQHERFIFELRVWPKRLQEVRDIPKTVIETSHQASVAGNEVFNNTELAAVSATGGYEYVVMRVRSQLEAAVILSGSLIRSAWREAGSPEQPSQSEPIKGNSVVRASQQATNSNFVGSKQSEIFHRRTCPHVKRIKPENLVQFDNIAKAHAVSRKACRTCKPN